MEHHPSDLAKLLTNLLGLSRHAWGSFMDGTPFSFIERYDYLLNAILAAIVTMVIVSVVKKNRIPGPMQQVLEYVTTGLRSLVSDNIHHHPDNYLPFIGTLALFIFMNNFFGLIPGLSQGTSNWNVTLALALLVFAYYNFHGMKEKGFFKYWAHFAGPIWWLAPLMFPLEILGLLSRNMSHSLRLFGNIVGEHIVTLIFFGLLPILLPVPLLVMGLFFGLIQAFVFTMLATIYLSGAVAHDH